MAAATQLQDFRQRRKSCKLSEAVCRRRKAAACRQSGAAAKRGRAACGFAKAVYAVQTRPIGFCRSESETNSDGRFQKETRSLTLPKPDSRRTSRREHGGAGAPDGGQAGRRKRSAARKPLSVCGLRHLCFSAVKEPSYVAAATQLLRPLRTRCIIPYGAGKTHTGRLPPAAAQTPSRGWAQRARPSRRTPRQEAVRSAEIPAFPRFPLFIPSPPARNAQTDEKRS